MLDIDVAELIFTVHVIGNNVINHHTPLDLAKAVLVLNKNRDRKKAIKISPIIIK